MPPNILVILSDQLRRDALSCYGDSNIRTDHIDALAAAGTRFDNACSTYPICVPFRFSLMTGQYAHSRMVPGIEWRMSPAERTMADEFNEAGYETVYVGKWHLYGGQLHMPGYSAISENRTPVPRKYQGRWETWIGFELRNGPFDTYYTVNEDPTLRKIDTYQTDGLFDLAMEHISEKRDESRPFCCVLSVEPPHPPYEAPPELEEKWLAQDIQVPPNWDPPEKTRERSLRERKIYYAMVENLNDNVGRMNRFLEEQGLADDTIVVFIADHGELGGSHGLNSKQHPYEPSVGIPLIIKDPTCPESAGKVVAMPTNTEDLFPTILGLGGVTPLDDVPGEDLTQLVRNDTAPGREGVMLQFVSETRHGAQYHERTWRAFRSERFKYTVVGDINGAHPWHFFDLENDPHEMKNLVDDPDWADEVKRHHQLLRDEMVRTEDDYVLAAAFGIEGLNLWQDV
jgi:arylsulfatase A-like enzyme